MKHRELHAIGHNFADSMASGLGFVIGFCETNVFADAGCNPDDSLTIDFLGGQLQSGVASDQLLRAISLFSDEFDTFCQKHGASRDDFQEFTVRFTARRLERIFTVTVKDRRGKRSSIDYEAIPGRRIRMLDDHGRVVRSKGVF